ncbi:hypothetical protein DB346_14965 [Verrucomicrobia bacterium LW23]|nr:hypothetical protein DB346_14965 [Verrucomicrobia bacterium LW23]
MEWRRLQPPKALRLNLERVRSRRRPPRRHPLLQLDTVTRAPLRARSAASPSAPRPPSPPSAPRPPSPLQSPQRAAFSQNSA